MGYVDKIITGLIVFPFIAALITMPYALYQYRRYSAISKYRTLIVYSFILYLLISYFQVILPLPPLDSTIGNRWQDHLNLIPFYQVWLYWKNIPFSLSAVREYLTSFSLWQLLLNIILTMPFGIYLRYYFKCDLKQTAVYSFLLSLFFELTQLSALYGIYPGPYRLADVEDLICNTLGGVLGWQIAYVFIMILPKRDSIDAYCREVGKKVSGTRRFWAVFTDYLFNFALFIFFAGAIYIVSNLTIDLETEFFFTFFCLSSLLQVLLTKGMTVGHAICRMILRSEDGEKASPWQLICRYLILWAFVGLPEIAETFLRGHVIFGFLNDWILLIVMVVPDIYYLMYFFRVVCSKEPKRMPHDTFSRTVYMATELPGEEH